MYFPSSTLCSGQHSLVDHSLGAQLLVINIVVSKMEAVTPPDAPKKRKQRHANESRKYKMVIVGEASVGKSNLLERIWQHRFAPSKRATEKCDVADIYVETNGIFVCFEVWDTAGQEMYRGLSESFYRNAHLCIIVYDVTRRATFKQVQWWYDELLRRAPPAMTLFGAANEPYNIILVGNKSDLEHLREVSYDEGKQLAEQWNHSMFCEHSSVYSQDLSPFMIEMAHAAERTLKCGIEPLEKRIQVPAWPMMLPTLHADLANGDVNRPQQQQAGGIGKHQPDSDCAC